MKTKKIFYVLMLNSILLIGCNNTPSTSSVSSSTTTSSSTSENNTTSENITTSENTTSQETTTEIPPIIKNPNLVYQLDFSDKDNLGKSTGSNETSSTINSENNMEIVENAIKGKTALKFNGAGMHQKGYIEFPSEILHNEATTITSWMYLPKDNNPTWRNEFVFSNSETNTYFRSIPVAPNNFQTYSFVTNMLGNGEEVLTMNTAQRNEELEEGWPSAFSGLVQPVFNAWYLMSYEFTSTSFKVYKNGYEIYNYDGDFSLTKVSADKFRFGANVSDQDEDYIGSFADIRVYDKALSTEEIIKEYDLTFSDLKTANFDFNDNINDSIRNFTSTKHGNAEIVEKDNRSTLYLDGNGNENADARSSITCETGLLAGHEQLTISTTLYLPEGDQMYKRIFEYSVGGRRSVSLYIGFGEANNIRFEYARHAGKNDRDFIQPENYKVPTNAWINITVTTDGKQGSIYVNGELIGSGTFNYNVAPFWCWYDLGFEIGRTKYYGDAPLNAYIDKMEVYNASLTQEEIKTII